jgi:hypothetical protein
MRCPVGQLVERSTDCWVGEQFGAVHWKSAGGTDAGSSAFQPQTTTNGDFPFERLGVPEAERTATPSHAASHLLRPRRHASPMCQVYMRRLTLVALECACE